MKRHRARNRRWIGRSVCLVLPVVVMFFLLAGCRLRITDANLKQLRPEMNPKEVESILGQPVRIEKFQMEVQTQKPVLDGVRYYYDMDGKTIALHFVDGKLISQAPTSDSKENRTEPPARKQ